MSTAAAPDVQEWLHEEDVACHMGLMNLFSIDWNDPSIRTAMSFMTFEGLIPDGEEVNVTSENLESYIQYKAENVVLWSIEAQMIAISRGVYDIIPFNQLSLYSVDEMRSLICGSVDRDVDVNELRAATTISGLDAAIAIGHGDMIDWFWSIVSKFDQRHLHKLVEFVSGFTQPPPHGFRGLLQDRKWLVISIESGIPVDGLPMAQLCFVQLRLPYFTSKSKMKKQLLLAIRDADTMETK